MPEHILLSPRAAIPGTKSESAATMLTAPTEKIPRMGPDGSIKALKKKKVYIKLASVSEKSPAEMKSHPGCLTEDPQGYGVTPRSPRSSSARGPALWAQGPGLSSPLKPQALAAPAPRRRSGSACGMTEGMNQRGRPASACSPPAAALILAAAAITAGASVLMFLVLLLLLLLFLLLLFFQTHLQLENAQNITTRDY